MRWCLALMVTAGTLAGLASAGEGELTPEERQKLLQESSRLNGEVRRHYQAGHIVEAMQAQREHLKLTRRLYPRESFPEGHSELAASLGNMGYFHSILGRLEEALEHNQQVLAMNRKLYPADRFPSGHFALATILNNTGYVLKSLGRLEAALEHYREALEMFRKLYPPDRFPNGHAALANSLDNMGGLLSSLGRLEEAQEHYQQALAMYRKLYPSDSHPEGNAGLASSLNNMGNLLFARGRTEAALDHLRQSLAMRRKLFPPEQFPDGHADLALSLNNLGGLLESLGRLEEALEYYQQALAMRRKLYPKEKYPDGHPNLAVSLNSMGSLLDLLGRQEAAQQHHQQALEMARRLYSRDRFPAGHPDLAKYLNDMANVLNTQGRLEEALELYQQSLAMYRKVYPPERFPYGHRGLAASLNSMGGILFKMARAEEARNHFLEALRLQQAQLKHGTSLASESQALAFVRSLPRTRDIYLSVTRDQPGLDTEACSQVWLSRAFITRLLQQRQQALRQAQRGSPVADKARELQILRQRIEQLISGPFAKGEERDALLATLTRRRDDLEHELAQLLPQEPRTDLDPGRLVEKLPGSSVFIDLLRYDSFHVDRSQARRVFRSEPHYLAFVLAAGQPIRRIELGPAHRMDQAVAAFRQDILRGQESPAAGDLAQQLWRPIADVLPRQTQTVFLAVDGDLARLPFAALPASKPGHHLLLEDFTLVHVPHGPFLLDRLLQPWKPTPGTEALLLLGNLDYGPAAEAQASGRQPYLSLPATAEEIQAIQRLARSRPAILLDRDSASPGRLRQELPRARFAHLASHGYFDEKGLNAEKQERELRLKTGLDSLSQPLSLAGRGSLSPLAYTGLVLSQANPGKTTEGGILTGEGLWNLPLEGLELAVLSACETGLGELTEGEAVVGLQRTLHLAGCRDVVASLWKVPDGSTAVLMEEFYRRLWDPRNPQPAAQALRQAQVWVCHHPDQVLTRIKEMRSRGIDLDLAELPNQGTIEKHRFSPARWWAAFVLSGDGGLIPK